MRGLLLVISIIALIAGLALIAYGYATKEIHVIPWGFIVVGYTFFALVTVGSTIVNSLYSVFGYKGPEEGLKRNFKYGTWLSISAIIPAWLLILADLAKPIEGFFRIIMSFAVEARIYWMAVFYAILAILLVIEIIYVIRVGGGKGSMVTLGLAIAALILLVDVLLASNLAQVFGSIIAVPGWTGIHLMTLFLAGAVIIGASGQALYLSIYKWRDKRTLDYATRFYSWIFVLATLLYIFLLAWTILTARYTPAWVSWSEVVRGVFSMGFWVVEVLLGVVVVLVIVAYAMLRRNPVALMLASIILFVVGFYRVYSLIVHHQSIALSPVGDILVLHYTPSTAEILMILGGFMVFIALLLLGTLLLPLEHEEKPRRLWIFR
jgi:Polysulphide reductase